MLQRSGQQGVPVIVIDDQVVVGFDRRRLEEILARPRGVRPLLGARVAGSEGMARRLGRSLPAGAYVGQVKAGSPAERVGLQEGDVILALGDVAVRGPGDLERALASLSTGQAAGIVWWRQGQRLTGRLVL